MHCIHTADVPLYSCPWFPSKFLGYLLLCFFAVVYNQDRYPALRVLCPFRISTLLRCFLTNLLYIEEGRKHHLWESLCVGIQCQIPFCKFWNGELYFDSQKNMTTRGFRSMANVVCMYGKEKAPRAPSQMKGPVARL